MKKTGMLSVIAIAVVAFFAIAVFAEGPGDMGGDDDIPDVRMGDVDGDGRISLEDVKLLQGYLLGTEPFSQLQVKAADMDGNGEINVLDMILISSTISGEPGSSPEP